MEMGRPFGICDFFIIASGNSARQVRAISDNIEEETRQKGIRVYHIEGYTEGSWVLLDYHDVVVHIFMQETREFYDLERLWADAPKTRFNDDEGITGKERGHRESDHYPSQ